MLPNSLNPAHYRVKYIWLLSVPDAQFSIVISHIIHGNGKLIPLNELYSLLEKATNEVA